MTRGIVLFAHNNDKDDYYKMAVAVAKRVSRFLGLPTSVITDSETLKSTTATEHQVFDKTILIEPDKTNAINKKKWYNKGRYQVYSLTPYDDTIVLDTDYLINSTRLLEVFEQPGDFQCIKRANFFFDLAGYSEDISEHSFQTYWATVIRFKKTERVALIFDTLRRVQNNYEYYAELFQFFSHTYRNDYALTFALKIVNGGLENPEDFINGRLIHVTSTFVATRVDDTTYDIFAQVANKTQHKRYHKIRVTDFDFHMLNKQNYLELVGNE
jgi:hypothetical protein